jgi:hypothetical protein
MALLARGRKTKSAAVVAETMADERSAASAE